MEELDLSKNQIVESSDIKALMHNKVLISVSFKDNPVTHNEDYLLAIEQNLPSLEYLD